MCNFLNNLLQQSPYTVLILLYLELTNDENIPIIIFSSLYLQKFISLTLIYKQQDFSNQFNNQFLDFCIQIILKHL